MSDRKRSKGRARGASAEVLFELALLGDEGRSRKPFDPREDRKTLQLCRQVERALSLALAGECGDDVLRDVQVAAVEPMGSASQLLVQVAVPGELGQSTSDVLGRLNARSAKLRAIVARSICRKRVPGLTFMAVPAGTHRLEGGQP